MKAFFTYLKERAGGIAVFFICVIIFTAYFALCSLPLYAVIYPSVLSLISLSVYFITDFIRERKKCRTLERLLGIPADIKERLADFTACDDIRYREIIEKLLLREKYDAEQNAERISDMVDYYTTWAHQIKTPISSMMLTLQGEDSQLSRRLSEDLFRIEQYVEMVMCYLRLDSKDSDYLFRECSLDKTVKGAVRKFAVQFIGKGLSIDYRVDDKVIVTDEKWFSFVVEQLLSNALKYTNSGKISVYTENGFLCVSDTGIGIAKSDLPRIFEKGYTGESGRADKRASGLGLYLCKRICDKLSYNITAESAKGSGTTIKIDIRQGKRVYE